VVRDDSLPIDEVSAHGRDRCPTHQPPVLHCTTAGRSQRLVRRVRYAEPSLGITNFSTAFRMQIEQLRDRSMTACAAEHTKTMRSGSDAIEQTGSCGQPYRTAHRYLMVMQTGSWLSIPQAPAEYAKNTKEPFAGQRAEFRGFSDLPRPLFGEYWRHQGHGFS
jgi:hypothetical protein